MLIYYIVQGAFSHAHFSAWPAAVKTYERSQICQNPTNYDFLGARKAPHFHHITFLHNRSHGYPQFGHGKEYPMNVSNITHEKVINRPQQANSIPGCGALCHYND